MHAGHGTVGPGGCSGVMGYNGVSCCLPKKHSLLWQGTTSHGGRQRAAHWELFLQGYIQNVVGEKEMAMVRAVCGSKVVVEEPGSGRERATWHKVVGGGSGGQVVQVCEPGMRGA